MADLNKKKIILMYGGCSGEHEISLLSASSVLSALDSNSYTIDCLAGDKHGHWYLTPSSSIKNNDPLVPLAVKNKSSKEVLLSKELFNGVYAVFPVMHGPLFEDGCLQGFLTLSDVAYVGSNHMASAISMDKAMAKIIAEHNGVAVAPYRIINDGYDAQEQDNILNDAVSTFGYPLFIKPVCMGSSVGIHKVNSLTELKNAVQDAFRYDQKVLIEQAVSGREIEVAVLKEKHNIQVSVAGEICITQKGDFYSYQAKYLDENAVELKAPAVLSKPESAILHEQAKLVFKSLGCEGLARVDFFLEDSTGKFILNEINTLPGFTKISMYPNLWQLSGISYPLLLTKLIEQANWSYKRSRDLLRDYS